jgi:hypothetical protein
MRNAKLFLFCKKIHRYLVFIILITGLCMMASGLCMYFNTYFFFRPGAIRSLHNNLSLLFTIVLGLMSLTGFYLFLFPYLPVKKAPPTPLQ